MAIVGTAYVEIRALTNKLDSDIQAALNKSVDRAASDAGSRAGGQFRNSFSDEASKIEQDAQESGRNAGSGFARGLEDSTSEIRDSVRGLEDELGGGGGGGGGLAGALAHLGGESGSAGRELRIAALQLDGFTSLASVGIGAIGSLGASVFSLGSVLGSASRSLAVYPAIIGSVVQGAITTTLAFQGVGGALKANEKLQQANAAASQAHTAALGGNANALKQAQAATSQANTAQLAFNRTLDGLPASTRAFVLQLTSMQGAYTALRNAAGEGLFPGLTSALQTLVGNGSLNLLQTALRNTGSALGGVAASAAQATSSPFFQSNFVSLTNQNASTLATLGQAAVNLGGYLAALYAAAGPLVQRFDDFVLALSRTIAASLDSGNEMQAMTAKFQRAGDIVAQLWRIATNLYDGISALSRAAQPAGQMLLSAFESATAGLRGLNDAATQSQLTKFFSDAATNTIAISALFRDLAGVLLSLADDPAVAQIANQLRTQLLPVVGEILQNAQANAPALATALVSVANAFLALSSSGALTTFLGVIASFADNLTALLNGPAGPVVAFLINLEAALSAAAVVRNFSGIGYLGEALAGVSSGAKTARAAFGDFSAGVQAASAIAAEGGAGASFVEKLAGGLTGLGPAGAAAGTALRGVAGVAASAGASIASGFSGAVGIIGSVGARIGSALLPLFTPLIAGIRGVGAAIALAFDTNPVGLIITAIGLLIAGIVLLWQNSQTFRDIVMGAWSGIQTAVGAVVNWFTTTVLPTLIGVWNSIISGLQPVLSWFSSTFGPMIQSVWNGIQTGLSAVVSFVQSYWPVIVSVIGGPIGALVVLVIQHFGTIKNAFQEVANFFVGVWNNVLMPVINFIGYTVGFVFGQVIPAVFDLFKTIVTTVFGAIVALAAFLINAAFQPIQAAAQFMWSNVLQPVFNFIAAGWSNLMLGIQTLWTSVLMPTWNAIQVAAQYLWSAVLSAIFNFIKDAWNLLLLGIQAEWNTILLPTWNAIQTAAQFMWNSVLRPTFGFIQSGWNSLLLAIQMLWNSVLLPTWNAVQTAVQFMWGSVLLPTFNFIQQGWNSMVSGIQTIWSSVLAPTWVAVQTAVTALYNAYIRPIFQSIQDRWNDVKNTIVNVYNSNIAPIFNTMRDAVSRLGGYFTDAVNAIRTAWQGVQAAAKDPVGFVINTVINGGIIDTFNKIATFFGSKTIPQFHPPGFAEGGYIRGPGTGTSDSIPAYLSDGEYVIRASMVRKFLPVLDAINYGGGLPGGVNGMPGYAEGGLVQSMSSWISSVTSGVTGAVRSVASAATGLATDPVGYFTNLLAGPLGGIANSGFGQLIRSFPQALVGYATDRIKGLLDFFNTQSTAATGGPYTGPVPTGNAVTRWAPLVAQTLGELGLSTAPDMVARILRQIQTESGGNPNATQGNIGDINNKTGDLARGLMQVIGATFRAYAGPYASLGQYDPHASLYAGLNYAKNRYGPSLSFLGQGHGYDLGGIASGLGFMPKYTIEPERVLSPRQTQAFENLVPLLSSRTADPAGDGLTDGERQIISALSSRSSGNVSITVNPPPETDVATLARLVSRELSWQMGNSY